MPLFYVTGWFKRATLREAWTEVEAPDAATAISAAQDEDADGDLDWREDNQLPEDTDKQWTARPVEEAP